ncbi:DUF2085 domain-containing protein [Methanocella sp. MCL-LM]|uniref:DUF2085 domain-containing protein n=1 Tax=Methanocella sp. MCL-LM TaxID=3412035 RepID=UPI003C714138
MANVKLLVFDLIVAAYLIIALSIFVPWVLLSIAPHDRTFLAICDFIGWFYSHLCHQLSFRTFYYDGIKMPVCARDTSIYIATALGLLFFRLKGFGTKEFKMNYVLLVLLFLPTAIDGFTQLFGFRESTNLLRLIAGFPYGLGYAYLIAWALPLIYVLIDLIIAAKNDGDTDSVIKRIKNMVWPFK